MIGQNGCEPLSRSAVERRAGSTVGSKLCARILGAPAPPGASSALPRLEARRLRIPRISCVLAALRRKKACVGSGRLRSFLRREAGGAIAPPAVVSVVA